ncbi:MAG: hypothetical protein R6W90_16400 [Ignavibacteriaceae bacterium]
MSSDKSIKPDKKKAVMTIKEKRALKRAKKEQKDIKLGSMK